MTFPDSAMHRTTPGAKFHYTKAARLALYFGIVLCGLGAIALLTMAAVAVITSAANSPARWFAVVVACGMALYLLLLVRLHLKHRHVYRQEYEVLESGISMTHEGHTQFISWNEMEAAEHMPVPSVFRLSAKAIPFPIVLFVLSIEGRKAPISVRNKLAEKYIRDGLSERLLRKWFPW